MKTKATKILVGAVMMGCVSLAHAQQLAFPEAQGWGRFATGGRTGTVYHVTNLNDSGSGSLRDAVSQPNRIVVFDVAGVIRINSRIVFSKNLYVAGQTAPGEGITVYGDGVSFSGADGIIVRYMKFRMGRVGSDGKDCAGIANGKNMIFDHCSFAWGRDETFSINWDSKGTAPQDITISNCIVSQGLLTHSAGGLMQADNISLYRNLYVDNSTRNNKIKGKNQYVNNVVYNWQNGAYIMGGDSEGESFCNIESNLFINGPAKGGDAFTGGNANFHFYGDDNWQDKNIDGKYDPAVVTSYSAADRKTTPYDYPELEKFNGNTLIDNLLPTVGASLPYRDLADCYVVDEVLSFGKKGALISDEASLPIGAPDTWTMWKGNARVDSDKDGMPDEWENANGTNPNVNDAMTIADNGYANIENYINSLTIDSRQFFLRTPMLVESLAETTSTLKIGWKDYSDNEEGFVVEMKKEGDADFVEKARTEANVNQITVQGLEPGTAYIFRVKAFAGASYSDYSKEVRITTRPLEVGIIDIDTYEADYVWCDKVTNWDFTSQTWNEGIDVYHDDVNVLIHSDADATISVDAEVAPDAIVVTGNGNITLNGEGNIGGLTSMNKAGEGTLAINTTNKYSGATVLHEGTIEFNSLKNGGEASAIGSSKEFAQNWIFDGGTYKYTGATTATNRSAKLMRPTVFNIEQSSAVVTMNGSLEGNSDFILDGKGQLKVGTTKFFTHTGATQLNGGTLYLSTVDIAKAGIGSSSKLVLNGGHLKTKGESSGYETYSFPIEVVGDEISQISYNRNCYINNKVTGTGVLQFNIPYLREYIKGDFSGFTGRIIANGISSESAGSLFLINSNSVNLKNTVIQCKGNSRVCIWDTSGSQTLGGLSGVSGTYLSGSSKQTDGFSCTWSIGSANTDETFAGKINNWSCSGSGHSGTVSINKVGTGLWRLTGSNDYKGDTNVKAGTLVVNGTNSGTGPVAVSKDATLKGKGTIAARVSLLSGATVCAGDTLINSSVLKLNGGLTANYGSIIEFPLKSQDGMNTSNRIKVTGALTINGATLSLDISNATSIQDGTQFTLFDLSAANVSGSGFANIVPEVPSENQVWDTSNLLTTGIISVKAKGADGINDAINDGSNDAPIYDLNGKRIPEAKGMYIRDGKKYFGK